VKLVFGVYDISYQRTENNKVPIPKKGRKNKPVKIATGQQTTGDVAGWLEDKYHVMEGFYDLHQREIAGMLENSLAGAIESMMQGAPASNNAFGDATNSIEQLFKFQYLDKEEITQTGADGVPTQAALDGVSKRFKLNKGPRRPSFIDTGDYQKSMTAWIE
jgi:hypothetical protein